MKINNNYNNNSSIAKTLLFLAVLIFLFSGCSDTSNMNTSEKSVNQAENNQIINNNKRQEQHGGSIE